MKRKERKERKKERKKIRMNIDFKNLFNYSF